MFVHSFFFENLWTILSDLTDYQNFHGHSRIKISIRFKLKAVKGRLGKKLKDYHVYRNYSSWTLGLLTFEPFNGGTIEKDSKIEFTIRDNHIHT